jgi:hypothetical protein
MIRKDPAQDTDRAHYYSTFWIEVAAGKPIGQGTQATAEDVEPEETDFEALLSAPPMATPAARPEPKAKPKPVEKKEPARSLSSLADLANIADLMSQSAQMEDDAVPDIAAGVGEGLPAEAISDFELDELPAEEEEPGVFADTSEENDEEFEDFEDEEEEEEDWGGSRRPKPKKPPRREKRPF